jgi:hypothetical protein
MVGNLRYPLMLAIVAVTLTGQVANGQTSGALQSAMPMSNVDGAFRYSPGSAPAPIPTDKPLPAEGPDHYLEPDVLPPTGWFVNVDTIVQSVHLRNRLMGTVNVDGMDVGPIIVDNASYNWTVSPHIETGYRLPHGLGEIMIGYRSLATDGSTTIGSGLNAIQLKSRFDLNVAEVNYAANEYLLAQDLAFRWKVGVAAVSLFFDNDAIQQATDPLLGPGVQQLHAANTISGGGPHVAMEASQRFPGTGLALDIRLEGYSFWEHLQQQFDQKFTVPGTPTVENIGATRTTQGTGVAIGEAGLRWTPPGLSNVNVFLGYHFEYWSQVGRNSVNGSRADFYGQGVILEGGLTF